TGDGRDQDRGGPGPRQRPEGVGHQGRARQVHPDDLAEIGGGRGERGPVRQHLEAPPVGDRPRPGRRPPPLGGVAGRPPGRRPPRGAPPPRRPRRARGRPPPAPPGDAATAAWPPPCPCPPRPRPPRAPSPAVRWIRSVASSCPLAAPCSRWRAAGEADWQFL